MDHSERLDELDSHLGDPAELVAPRRRIRSAVVCPEINSVAMYGPDESSDCKTACVVAFRTAGVAQTSRTPC
ncbi:hypothetical protein ABZX12_41095 [Kribbella sp. NPDC003505]|uniref:hypothetical protein n=1 Tax=Kribbella sp. NPDC003505 TaxID=3154448 RepID=UPI0033A7C624